MKKILYIFISLCLAILVSGCSKKKVTYKFYNVYDTSYFDNGKEVSTIKVKGVPSEAIEIGYFSYAGIYLEVTYTDGTKENVAVTERLFPESELMDFKIPGKKNYDLVYKDTHMSLKFELKEATQDIKYQVNFHDRDGKIIYTTYCSYLDEVKCLKEDEIKNYTDGKNIYVFNGNWGIDLKHVFYNLDLYPKYDKCLYMNADDGFYSSKEFYQRADIIEGSTYHQLIGVGKINNVLLASLETLEVTEAKNQTLIFDKKNTSSSCASLIELMGENITNLVKDYYIHDYWSSASLDIKLVNGNKLNFNTNVSNSIDAYVDEGITNSIDIPSFITTSFSNYPGFSGYTREDGHVVSNKNVLDASNPEFFLTEFIGKGDNASKIEVPITPDYQLGFYRMDFLCNLNVFIDLTYHIESTGGYGRNYVIEDAKIGFTYEPGGSQFKLRYSEDGSYDSYGIPITVSDYHVLLTLAKQ